jgi:NADH-quinone oxidoreductase subunit C
MSKPPPTDAVAALRERFPQAVTSVRQALGEVTCYVDPAAIVEVCKFLRDDPRFEFNMLADLCGVDLGIDQEPRFEVVYHLNSLTKYHRLRLKAQLVGDEPSIDTVTTVWKTANWLERETFDMFGIDFVGHPDLRRILMPEEFQWHPLRKDYPVRGYDDF